jgi:threonine dehydratase
MPLFSLGDVEAAARRIHAVFPGTPQYQWPTLTARVGAEIWVKHENHAPTGAFKVRGGLIYLERFAKKAGQSPGIISATRGNHGQSLAFAGRRFEIPVTILAPEGNSLEKNAAMRALGARLIEFGLDFDAARAEAMRLASELNLTFVPSFHRDLVLGVATWALELFRAAPKLDALYVPIGLGSGICGAIGVRDVLGLDTEIIGVQSVGAPSYANSLAAGRVLPHREARTRADGIATRVPDPLAFEIIRAGASRIVTVTDDEIAAAIRIYWADTHNLAEGAGAAPLAALWKERQAMAGKKIGLPLCGGNIDFDLFRDWVCAAPTEP